MLPVLTWMVCSLYIVKCVIHCGYKNAISKKSRCQQLFAKVFAVSVSQISIESVLKLHQVLIRTKTKKYVKSISLTYRRTSTVNSTYFLFGNKIPIRVLPILTLHLNDCPPNRDKSNLIDPFFYWCSRLQFTYTRQSQTSASFIASPAEG